MRKYIYLGVIYITLLVGMLGTLIPWIISNNILPAWTNLALKLIVVLVMAELGRWWIMSLIKAIKKKNKEYDGRKRAEAESKQ